MKKTLLTIIAALLLGGVVNAQNGWDTDPNSHTWSSNTPIVAAVSIEGVAQTDLTNLTLGAFAGEELRGRANVANHSVDNNQFWIQVFYNYNTTEAISFKLYDAATQIEYTTCTVTPHTTTQDEGWGTPGNPVVLDFSTTPQTQTQTIALTAGTNWFSTYVDITLDDLKAALVAAAAPNSVIKIKSATQTAQYSRNRWNGDLDWDVAKMYKIEVVSPCEISLEGSPINPAEHSITLAGGGQSTWIGFPFSESMSLTNAFAEVVQANDRVKSGISAAQFSRNRWNGEFNLEPNKGYIFISAPTAGDRVLIYPAPSNLAKDGNK